MLACATTVLRGVICGSDIQGTITTSLIALALFFGLGLVFGELARRLIEDYVHVEWERQNAQE